MKPKHQSLLRPVALVTAITAFAAASASAATYQWDGGAVTGDWQTAANWSPDALNTTFNSTTNNRMNVNGAQALIYTAAEGTTVYANSGAGLRGLVIGSAALGSGTMIITGGTFSTAGSAIADIIGNTDGNTGTLTINGGNYISGTLGTALGGGSANNNLNVQSGTATITTLSIHTTGTSTTSLTGGTLEVDKITTTVAGTYTINLDGGTLKAGAGADGAFMSGLTNAYVKSNGARIDSNGKSITISQNLVDFTTPSGGGLTLNDTAVIKGTLTLSGTGNTYTGATTVNAGTLVLNGSTDAASAVTVGGATATGSPTLSGTGTVNGTLTIAAAAGGAAGTVNPATAGTTGTLSAGATTIAGTYACDVISAAADTLAVTGNLDLTGAKFVLISVTPTPGTYTIATYTGSLTSTFTPTPALPAGTSLDYATTGEIKLVIAAASGYGSWASTNSVLEGENGDDDKDGVINLVEYALGLNPKVGNPAPGTFTGNTLTFTKGTEAKTALDVTYKIQTSTTLATGSWTDAAATETTDNISFLLPSNQPGGKLFGRLQVTKH